MLIKIKNNVYKVKANECDYVLKIGTKQWDEQIYNRLKMLNLDNTFVTPIKTTSRELSHQETGHSMELHNLYSDDYLVAKDIKLRYYITEIANLHNRSFFTTNVTSSHFEQITAAIKEKIDETLAIHNENALAVERLDYKSPSQWLYMLNYDFIAKALGEATSCLEKFAAITKEKTNIRLSLVYLNFDYEHIFISDKKIISNQKMTVASPVYDIKDLFDKASFGAIDLSAAINLYTSKFILNDYEVKWLLTLLFIPNLKMPATNDLNLITRLNGILFQIRNAMEIAKILNDD